MKRSVKIFFLIFLACIILSGCKGSKNYQGSWYGEDSSEKECEIIIAENSITIVQNGEEAYEYKQHTVGTKNGIKYYGITLDDDNYSIIFPEKGEETIAMILKPQGDDQLSGELIYALNKEERPSYVKYAERY